MYKSSVSVKKEIVINLVFWLIWSYYNLVIVSNQGVSFAEITLFQVTGYIVYVSTFYLNYLFVLKRVFKPFRWRRAVLGFFTSYLFFATARYLLEEVLMPSLFGKHNYYPGTGIIYYYYDNLFYSFYPIILSTVLWSVILLVRTLDYNNYMIREQKNMEIKFLKAQINPHFIFNTLNNIYSMVHFQSPNALSAIEKLSNIMRFTTYEAQKSQVHLSEEINYMKSYIELEELRHYEKSFVEWEVDVQNEHIEIPPYLLSPFVENALKHGAFSHENPIRISLYCDNEKLEFEVKNEIGNQKKDQVGGIGLQNLETRLEILYPNKHRLQTLRENAHFSAKLQIQLR